MFISQKSLLMIFSILIIKSNRIDSITSISRYRLLPNSNLTASFLSKSLIKVVNAPTLRFCLSQCNQDSTCLLANYDSSQLTCSLFDSGVNSNDLVSVTTNLNIYYRERSSSLCTNSQYYDNYSCGMLFCDLPISLKIFSVVYF